MIDTERLRAAWLRHVTNSGHGGSNPPCSPRCSEAIANQYRRNYAADPIEDDDEQETRP